jgi:hypothetical protein
MAIGRREKEAPGEVGDDDVSHRYPACAREVRQDATEFGIGDDLHGRRRYRNDRIVAQEGTGQGVKIEPGGDPALEV